MTIDEAIVHTRKVAEDNRKQIKPKCEYQNMPWIDDENESFEKCAEEHEQIAEWLEELKAYKGSVDYYAKMFNEYRKEHNKIIYNQALEDMANKLKSEPYWDDEHNFQAIPIDYVDEVLEEITIK